jgi:hypothetical protein
VGRADFVDFYVSYGSRLRRDSGARPAYLLSINVTSDINHLWGFIPSYLAVCALDGSWITPFEYINAVFADEVIFLTRDWQTFDVDVYDYNGVLLYNLLELEWAEHISEYLGIGNLMHGTSEGYGYILMNNGTFAFIDVLTGRARYTEYIEVGPFFDGLAAVQAATDSNGNRLWGFINRDFRLEIPHRYAGVVWPFSNGRAVVNTLDGSMQIINKGGETLFSVPEGYHIDMFPDGAGFVVYTRDRREHAVAYTDDFVRLEPPEKLQSQRYGSHIHYAGDGVYSAWVDDGMLLFTYETELFFQNAGNTFPVGREHIVYVLHDETGFRTGVVTHDGRDIIPVEEGVFITPVVGDGVAKAFIINTNAPWQYSLRPAANFRPSVYRLVDTEGNVIASGPGTLTYDGAVGLFYVLGTDYVKWLDADGNTLISIPLMSSTFD